jgi:hypothetical protein
MATGMGCDGLISVLYAKADPIRVSRHKYDRHSMNQKANTLASPTFIFRSPKCLKYFLDHFQHFMDGHLPPFIVGHAEVALPSGPTPAQYRAVPVPLKTFSAGRTFSLYLSNAPENRHKELIPPKSSDAAPKFDHYEAISSILDSAKRDLSSDRFNDIGKRIVDKYWPSDDINSTQDALSRVRFSPSRSATPNRNRESPETSPRMIHQRRAISAAQERMEASKNLEYTYFTESDADSTEGNSGQPSSESRAMELVGNSKV